jgi:hypothetical protein
MTIRFDVVVSNFEKIELFLENISKIKNLDRKLDRIVIMDCSNDPQRELEKLTSFKSFSEFNFLFFSRRNWNLNHGAQLDYVWLINHNIITQPKYISFMQEHYLNTEILVKSDTIPAGQTLDLDLVEDRFCQDPRQIIFNSRFGFRVSAMPKQTPFDDYKNMESFPISFVVDGGNFFVVSDYLQTYFKNREYLIKHGNGRYSFCHVWETRLTKIFYDDGFTFFELSRGLSFATIVELLNVYPEPCDVWRYAYQSREAWLLYGRDSFTTKFPFRECLKIAKKLISENSKVNHWKPPIRLH